MATNPIFTKTPRSEVCIIPSANAQVKTDGTSAGGANDQMILLFSAGADGSFIDKIWFVPVSATPATSAATVLNVYMSTTTGGVGATTNANTHLVAQVSAIAGIRTASTTDPTPYLEVTLNFNMETGWNILVSQAVTQGGTVQWQAVASGADY
jgi:hypothetical protein